MSEMAKQARAANRAKAERMVRPTTGRIDASDFTYPEPLNTEAKTGARPVSRRAYKSGGSVAGKEAAKHAGRKPRKTGGTVASYAADSTKEANPSAHVGAYKRGGATGENGCSGTRPTGGRKAHASGGAARRYVGSDEVTADEAPEALGIARPRTGMIRGEGGKLAKSNPVIIAARKADEPEGRKVPSAAERDKAYKAHREKNPLPARNLGMIDRALNKIEGHKKGGRTERKAGGRTKGKTNINIIISTGKGQGQGQPPMMPPPMPPGGAPVPVPAAHPPMPPMGGGAPPPAPPPMPRKSGGRAAARTSGYKSLEAGAGSGLGRLQKAHSSK